MGGSFGGTFGRLALGAVGFGLGSMIGYPALGASLGMALGNMLSSPKQDSGTRHVRGALGTSSQESVPLPIAFGRIRIGGTLMWMDEFVYHESESSAGGKGGGGSVVDDAWYTVNFAMIICEGPATLIKMYQGKNIVDKSVPYIWYKGTDTQSPNGFLTLGTGKSIAYKDTCYVLFRDFDVGINPQIPQMTFEIQGGETQFTVSLTGKDANGFEQTETKVEYIEVYDSFNWITPAWAIHKLITNSRYGGGFTEEHHLDKTVNWATAHNDCVALEYYFNLAFTERRSLSNLIEICASHGWITTIFSGTDITLLLANGDEPTKTIDVDAMLGRPGEQIISVAESARSERFNRIAVEFTDPAKEYSTRPIQVEDIADQQDRGLYKNSVSLPGFTNKDIAKHVGYKMLRNSLFGRRLINFTLGPEHLTSEPGDIVLLNATSVGISQMRARLVGMDETEEFNLTVTFREEPTYIYDAIGYEVPNSSAVPPQSMQAGLSQAIGFSVSETPFELSLNPGNVDIALLYSSTNDNTIGFNVYYSTDNSSYTFLQQTRKLMNYAEIVTDYGKNSWLDQSGEIVLDVTASDNSTFSSTTRNEMMNGSNIALVGDEMVLYQTSSLGETNIYTLSNFVRNRFNTKPQANAVGDSFISLDSVDSFTFLKNKIGNQYYFKAVPINNLGLEGDISEVTPIGMTVEGWAYRPYHPGSLWLEEYGIKQRGRSVAGHTRDVKVAWDIVDKSTGFGRYGYNSSTYGIYTQDPDYIGAEVDVVVSDVVMRTADVGTTQSYVYTQAYNVADNGSMATEVDFRVYTKSIYGRSKDYTEKTITIL